MSCLILLPWFLFILFWNALRLFFILEDVFQFLFDFMPCHRILWMCVCVCVCVYLYLYKCFCSFLFFVSHLISDNIIKCFFIQLHFTLFIISYIGLIFLFFIWSDIYHCSLWRFFFWHFFFFSFWRGSIKYFLFLFFF